MDLATFLYIIGAGLVPAIGWAIKSHIAQRDLDRKLSRLLEMHEHPENTGFGTVGFKDVIEDNTRALKALTHYIRYLEVQRTGVEPPPPLEDV